MRVLLTTVRLEARAGSELYVADVALWLRDHGHQPMVYTARPGPFADDLRRESIPIVSNLRDVGETPDVIHAQHHLATMSALGTFPLVAAVGFCHGWIPWEEAPARHPAIRRYVAVSGVTRERIVTEGGVPAGIVRVVPNFVDLDLFRPRAPLPERPRRALVFSNSARPGGWLDTVLAACEERGIAVDVRGLGIGQPLRQPEAILPDYDLVFGRGRSALEAMAVGAAVVLCDVEGCGPFVTAAEFDRLREGNFGQAVMRQPHVGPYLGEQIDRYDATAAAAASGIVRMTLGRDHIVPLLLSVYEEAIAEASARPHDINEARAAEQEYLRWLDCNYPRPVLDSFRALDRRIPELEYARDLAWSRTSEAEAGTAEARAESGHLRAEADRFRAEADAVRTELEELRSGCLTRVVVPRLWRLRERVAPTRSRRYRLCRAVQRGPRQSLARLKRGAISPDE
jgi:hypothetical protein